MTKAEVEALNDYDLKREWAMIKAAYRSGLPASLNDKQYLVLFVNFVNVCTELSKRGIEIVKEEKL